MTELGLNFRDVLDSAPDGILVADLDGRIRFVNRQVSELFGYSEHELLGATVEVLVPERLRSRHEAHRSTFALHPSSRPMGLGLDLIASAKDGREFPVEISLSPRETPSGTLVIAVIRDVTERRRLQEERNALAVELETERERHRIGMDLHDGIMQSIYAVTLRLELALEEDASKQRQYLERAIDELHNISRDIRSYIFDLRPRQFTGNVAHAIGDLAEEFQQNTQIATSVDIQPNLPVVGDEPGVSLYLITHEALSNVHKHAAASKVDIRLGTSNGAVTLEIEDDGCGFDPSAERPERHYGLRNMNARAKAIGADIAIESRPNQGTRIFVKVPLHSASSH